MEIEITREWMKDKEENYSINDFLEEFGWMLCSNKNWVWSRSDVLDAIEENGSEYGDDWVDDIMHTLNECPNAEYFEVHSYGFNPELGAVLDDFWIVWLMFFPAFNKYENVKAVIIDTDLARMGYPLSGTVIFED